MRDAPSALPAPRGTGMGNQFGSYNDMAGGFGGLFGGLLGNLFGGYKNPADAGMPYLNDLKNQLPGYYQDYINRGQRMGGQLEGQYGQLMNDPGNRLNQIGQGYKQSPGFQFAMQQALQGGNHAAAAGGMAGSPAHEQQNMQLANNVASQDYNQWLSNALGMYNTGLQGGQNMYGIGANSSNALAGNMSQLAGTQAQLAYEGQNAQNQRDSGMWGSMGSGLGSLLGFL